MFVKNEEIGRVLGSWGRVTDDLNETIGLMSAEEKQVAVLTYIARLIQDRGTQRPFLKEGRGDLEVSAMSVSAGVDAMVRRSSIPGGSHADQWPGGCVLEVARRELGIRERKAVLRALYKLNSSQNHYSPSDLESVPRDVWERLNGAGEITLARVREWCLKYGIRVDIKQ